MAVESDASSVSFSSFFAVRWASGAKPISSFTSASVAASSLSSATISVAMPQSSACCAAMRRERMTMSLVRVMPTIFCSRADPPDPGIWPSRCSGRPYWQVSEIRRKSQASESSNPTPRQSPRLAAITGFAQRAGAAMFHARCDTVSGEASRNPLM